MIASLSGRVAAVEDGAVVVDVGGVGYLVHVPVPLLADAGVGASFRLLTHLVVREDSMTLYGFADQPQRDIFRFLIGVTGVGAKLALALLSAFRPDELRRAVASEDVGALTGVPGIGKRTAQRIVLELKERLGAAAELRAGGSKLSEVREALVGLGYAPAELRAVLDRIGTDEAPVEELLKSALKELSLR